jgi:hypothetical protein
MTSSHNQQGERKGTFAVFEPDYYHAGCGDLPAPPRPREVSGNQKTMTKTKKSVKAYIEVVVQRRPTRTMRVPITYEI